MNQSLTIIQNGMVFTGDAHQRSGPWAILVQGGRIAKLGTNGDALRMMYPTADVVDATGKVILPGFVDPHIHGESFLLRSATALVPMSRWSKDQTVANAIKTFYSEFTPEETRQCYELSYFAALRNGVTTLGEFGFDRLEMSFVASTEAFRRTDLGGVVGIHNGDQAEAARRMKRSSLRFSVVLPDAESLTAYSLQTRLRLARDEQWGITLALAETRRDADAIRKNFQRSIVQLAEEHGLLAPPVHMVHLAHIESGDVETLAKAKIPILVNPTGFVAKATEYPAFPELVRAQIPIALCSDWGIADPFLNIKSFVQLVRFHGLTIPKAEHLLAMVSSLPARVLGLQNEIGTIAPGKRADLTFIDMNDFRLGAGTHRRAADLLHDVFLYSTTERVTEVMINGEFFVRNGQLLTVASEDLARNTRILLERILGPLKAQAELAMADQPTDASLPGTTDDLPFEEGFRIVRRGEGAERIFHLPDRPAADHELPKDVKRVFGEDDTV